MVKLYTEKSTKAQVEHCGRSNRNIGFVKYTECNSYSEYIDVETAKFKRGELLFCGEIPYYIVDTNEKINDVLSCISEDTNPNLFSLVTELKENKGKVFISEFGRHSGVLTAVEICPDDYYNIIESDTDKYYVSGTERLIAVNQ